MEISAPKEWYVVLDGLEKGKGIAILLGATDTGKSILAKFLVSHLCQKRYKGCLRRCGYWTILSWFSYHNWTSLI